MTSPGKLSSAVVEFVAPLWLWPGLRLLPMVGPRGERPADRRALEGAASRGFSDVQAMFKRVKRVRRESARTRASF